MSGATMYELKRIITREKMTGHENSCMYQMKNIHDIHPTGDHASRVNNTITGISEQSPLPEVAVLEARQEKILAQLAELKEQVLSLCDVLKLNNSGKSVTSSKDAVSIDLVINVDPRHPCWSICAFQSLWKDVNFNVTSYRHSSIEGAVPELPIQRKKDFRDNVNVSLIWKNVEDLETVTPGIRGYPLIGETNFIRYLLRRLDAENYENSSGHSHLDTLDSVLDLSHRLHYQDSPKGVHSTVAEIAQKLGKKNWFYKENEAGVADVAAWSAIKQSSLPKIPLNLISWFERCESKFLT